MAEAIVVHEAPAVACMQIQLMRAVSQLRMMKTYIETHIDASLDGPNGGDAAADLENGCDAVCASLDELMSDLDELDTHVVTPFLRAKEEACMVSSGGRANG